MKDLNSKTRVWKLKYLSQIQERGDTRYYSREIHLENTVQKTNMDRVCRKQIWLYILRDWFNCSLIHHLFRPVINMLQIVMIANF